MKIKEQISEKLAFVLVVAIFILFLPFFLLYLIFKVLYTPFDYMRYKRTLYQKDFPHKYTWLREPHVDNEAYTAIKENGLPIEYVRLFEDYDMAGRFVYNDTLLWFYSSIFFDKDKKLWLWGPGDKNDEEESPSYSHEEDDIEYDNTDDCLSIDELKTFILGEFNNSIKGQECHRVVFFYERKKIEQQYGKEALKIMCELDDFITYEKGELVKAIKEFIDTASSRGE